jgi:AcrR family transcriptional regulator
MNDDRGTRGRLLDQARNLFAKNGFRGTSIRAVTAAAGANLGAVTYHFGSKQALYEAVISSMVAPLEGRMNEVAGGEGTPIERILRLVRTAFGTLGEHPEMAAIILHELALDRPLPSPAQRWVETLYGILIRLIGEGQAHGSIVAGDPRLLAASVFAQPFYFIMARRPIAAATGIRTGDPYAVAHVLDAVRRLLGAR